MNTIEPPFGVYAHGTEIGDKNGHICTAENSIIAADIVLGLSIAGLIDALREDEGDSVMILCDNPEGDPNNAVECCGGWTGYDTRRISGTSLLDALSTAYIEMMQCKAAMDCSSGNAV